MAEGTRRGVLYASWGVVAATAGCLERDRLTGDHRDGATIRAVGGVEPPPGAPLTDVETVDVDSDLLQDVLDVAVADDPEVPPAYDRRASVRFDARRVTSGSRDVTEVRVVADRFSPGVEAAVGTLSELPSYDADEASDSGIYVDDGGVAIRLRYSVSVQTP